MAGIFVAVAGPSGAGKDSLIGAARDSLAGDTRYVFVRRVVTRPSDASEAHDTLSAEAFRVQANDGAFALWWEANGLLYGLPASVLNELAAGHVVVANVSRDVLPMLRSRFSRVLVVHVTASAEILAQRLVRRGREAAPDQGERLSRSLLREQTVEADVRIENNGHLGEAGDRFLAILKALAPGAR